MNGVFNERKTSSKFYMRTPSSLVFTGNRSLKVKGERESVLEMALERLAGGRLTSARSNLNFKKNFCKFFWLTQEETY